MKISTWFTPASEGQVRVTRMAADLLNVRQQASRLDIRKQFYPWYGMVDGWNKAVNIFKMAYKKQRGELEVAT